MSVAADHEEVGPARKTGESFKSSSSSIETSDTSNMLTTSSSSPNGDQDGDNGGGGGGDDGGSDGQPVPVNRLLLSCVWIKTNS